ncbi:MAG: M6 family metalloprotease domain-containing protein [Kiritimatiellia bacterium]
MDSLTQRYVQRRLAVILTVLVLPLRLAAVPACPTPVTIQQPDGIAVTIRLRGDENQHWHEDAGGYSIMKNEKGWWAYAVTNALGALTPGIGLAGHDRPETLSHPRHLKPPRSAPRISAPLQTSGTLTGLSSTDTHAPTALAAKTGTMKNLVVLVQFPDKLATRTAAQFTNLFNQIGYTAEGAAGSVKDFYNEVSRNRLNVDSVIADWVTLSHGYAYYGANDIYGYDMHPREMVQEALALLHARGFDFSQCDADNDGQVDGLTIIHAGGGEEYGGNDSNYIWSHQWHLTSTNTYDGKSMFNYHTEPERRGWDSDASSQGITRIGVICHETGHFLGLPDLYDTTYASSGIGDFCLMAGGSWNGNYGTQPAHPSIYCKYKLGWVTPTVVSFAGTYTVPRIEDSTNAFRINGNWLSTQYLLIENRQGYGFDAGLPGPNRGLLFWHIDETQTSNDNASRYMVDLEEASGTQDLQLAAQVAGDDNDYYRGGYKTQFTTNSSPTNRSYENTPLGLSITNVSTTGANMTFTLQGPVPYPVLTLVGDRHDDTLIGNGDRLVDPGETIRLFVTWTNSGSITASNCSATLTTGSSGVSLLQSSAAYSNIAPNRMATNSTPFIYQVAKNIPAGTFLTFTNVITANEWVFTGTFNRAVGRQISATNTLDSANVPKAIVDSSTIYIDNTITLAGVNYLDDVNASVRLDHTFDSDLTLALQHPDGTVVLLSNRRGGLNDNYGTGLVRTVFDDQAASSIINGSAPFAGSYRPEAPLSALNGKAVNGVWRLQITDALPSDSGTAIAFGLTLVTHGTQWVATVYNAAPIASNQTVTAAAGLATNLLLRGSDPDGDAFTFRTNSLPLHGMLSAFNTNSGTITYTADPSYGGPDSFTFVTYDTFTSSAPATVTLNVSANSITCTVVSAYGGVTSGAVVANWSTFLTQSVTNSPVSGGVGTQYVCFGATVAGNAFTQVSPTNVTLTLTNHATLTWNWLTNYWLHVDCGTNGSVTPPDSWIGRGSNIQVTATPAAYFYVSGWSGQTNGGTFISSNQLSLTMDAPRTIQVGFAAFQATNNVPQWWLAQYSLTNGGFDAGALLDSDNDGVLNWAEYVAGTDPTNPASVLHIAGFTPGFVDFTPAFASRRYVVLTSTNLLSTNWTPLAAYQPGTGTVTTLTAPSATSNGFYRIGVQLP